MCLKRSTGLLVVAGDGGSTGNGGGCGARATNHDDVAY